MSNPTKPDIQHYSFDGKTFLVKIPNIDNLLVLEISNDFKFEKDITRYILTRKTDDVDFFYMDIQIKSSPFVFRIGHESVKPANGLMKESITTWSDTKVFRR